MSRRRRDRGSYRGRFESRLLSGNFDLWKNIAAAVLIGALKDLDSNSPWYRKQAVIWLNSEDCLSLCLELAVEDSVRDYLIERNLVIPILAYDSPRLEHVIPIIFRPEDLSQLSWPDRI